MEELKNCPFCGGKASLFASHDDNKFFVKCDRCSIHTLHRKDKKIAIYQWNKRVYK